LTLLLLGCSPPFSLRSRDSGTRRGAQRLSRVLGLRTVSPKHPFDLGDFGGYFAQRVPETDEGSFENGSIHLEFRHRPKL
jgi:hypothetical protein